MTALDFMALTVLLMMVVIGVSVFLVLGALPGRIAKKRGHRFATAIQIGGWATLALAVVGWPFVLMWAYAGESIERNQNAADDGSKSDQSTNLKLQDLVQRLSEIENRLEKVEG